MINAEIALVEQDVNVRPQQEPVVDSMFATGGHRPDMCGLEHGTDPVPCDGAPSAIGPKKHGLEGPLSQPRPNWTCFAEHRAIPLPGGSEIHLRRAAMQAHEELSEVRGDRRISEVVAFTLNDVRSELRRSISGLVARQESDVPHEYTADLWIVLGPQRTTTVAADASKHLIQTDRTIGLIEDSHASDTGSCAKPL